MLDSQRVIAVIPARSGSKGIINKNVSPCSGKPLMAWTIEAARRSKYIDRVVVSTDDVGIAGVGVRYGAEYVIRPPELATDDAPMPPVLLHALRNPVQGRKHETFDIAVLLQPTSPLRTTEDIDGAIELLTSSGQYKTVTSVYGSHRVPFSGTDPVRRQDRAPTLYLNGAIYAVKVMNFMDNPVFIDEFTVPYVMSEHDSLDVDYPKDLALAGLLIGQ
jgi:CMP-N,N'-diacetyllegionaminic acid synthase